MTQGCKVSQSERVARARAGAEDAIQQLLKELRANEDELSHSCHDLALAMQRPSPARIRRSSSSSPDRGTPEKTLAFKMDQAVSMMISHAMPESAYYSKKLGSSPHYTRPRLL